jgi:hypothetical protein
MIEKEYYRRKTKKCNMQSRPQAFAAAKSPARHNSFLDITLLASIAGATWHNHCVNAPLNRCTSRYV